MAVDTGCRATADIRVRSPTVDTPLYPVTLPWTLFTVQLESLQVPFVPV